MVLKNCLILMLFFIISQINSQEKNYKFPQVRYISLIDDLNDYYLYANSGSDADWYVGYNKAWIVKLPPIDTQGYIKSFVGVKLGRAKNVSYPEPTDLTPVDGNIRISVSNSPKFVTKSYILCNSVDIPMENPEEESVKWFDSAKWFWVEVPIETISNSSNNYIAVWSDSLNLKNSMTAPIIAGGYLDDGEENVWINTSIKGSISSVDNILELSVSGIKPAIAIKLIPENDYRVIIKNLSYKKKNKTHIFSWTVIAADAQKTWLEISYDKIKWDKFSRYLFNPPYSITFADEIFPKDVFYVKACGSDMFENIECSQQITIKNLALSEGGN